MYSMLVPGAWWPVSPRRPWPGAQLQAVRVRHAPVGDVGGVEGGLEQLVLQQDPLVLAEPLVGLAQRGGQAVLPVAQVVLPRVVHPSL